MAEDKSVKKKGFFKGMKSELKKVIWPTGEQTVKSTFATIAFVIMVSLVLIVFNLLFNWMSGLWINSLRSKDVINNPVVPSGDVVIENQIEMETNTQTVINVDDENETNTEENESNAEETTETNATESGE